MPKTILIIEDEAEIVDALRYVIESEGMHCVWASQGRTGLKAFGEQHVDLIILDVGLPDCSGFELLKQIRQTSDVPVMMLTARSSEVDKVVGLEIGADDYVTKPFSVREVVARIKAILKRSQPDSRGSTTGFELNNVERKILYFNTLLSLTPAEFELLTALIACPGKVFSRQELIERIWSDQHPSDVRVIDTHVKAIRAKLQKIMPKLEPIETHRSIGYSLKSNLAGGD